MNPDLAERWLQENDPKYAESRKAWKDLRDEGYAPPAQESPWDNEFLIGYLDEGRDPTSPVADRFCDLCGGAFAPREAKHRFCSNACKQRDYRRRVTAS